MAPDKSSRKRVPLVSDEKCNERYKASLRGTTGPVRVEDLPKVKMDLAGLSHYAKAKGVSILDLTEEERKQFGCEQRFPSASTEVPANPQKELDAMEDVELEEDFADDLQEEYDLAILNPRKNPYLSKGDG